MKELRDEKTRQEYIFSKTKELLDIVPTSIEVVDVGVLNYVYRATSSFGNIYFKQGLPHAKKAGLLGKDLLSINHLRIKYEKKVIDILRPAMPDSIALPLIYGYDEENNILIMSDVASSGTLLQDALLQGEFNPEASANIGRFLGISHRETYRKGIVIRESKEDYQHHWEIFLNMRTKGINTNAETLRELSRLYQKSLENQTTDILINMDCCPKNLFQRKDGSIGVIDFEVAS